MAHSSEIRWVDASNRVSQASSDLLRAILNSEELYQELLETYQFAGGSDELLAQLLFNGTYGSPIGSPGPTQEQIDMATDLRLAMVAAHELYQCLTNQVVSQSDRANSLRRMS